jgi:hypothetical protein
MITFNSYKEFEDEVVQAIYNRVTIEFLAKGLPEGARVKVSLLDGAEDVTLTETEW